MTRNTLIAAAAVASITSGIVVAIAVWLLSGAVNDQNRRSGINLCDGGNITRAYQWADASQSGAHRVQRVQRADKLLPIRDCPATIDQGSDVTVTTEVRDQFRAMVFQGQRPVVRDGRIVTVDGKPIG
ncbi:MAG: hypothetical protein JWM31_2840 [Solirubrobacterales bacterium]|nr:hypothetical protein [Solirubrobacterales bacterium]